MKSDITPTLVGAVTPLILSVAIFMTCIRAGVGNVMRAWRIKASHSYTSPVRAYCDSAQNGAHRSSRSSFFYFVEGCDGCPPAYLPCQVM
jgi:hypothetical protein